MTIRKAIKEKWLGPVECREDPDLYIRLAAEELKESGLNETLLGLKIVSILALRKLDEVRLRVLVERFNALYNKKVSL